MGADLKTWLLASDHSHLPAPRIETSPIGDDFESWFLTNGGYIHPSVEIAADDQNGNFLRVKQNQILSPGSIVVSCPHHLTISWPIIKQLHSPDVHSTFTPHVATRLFLMKQRLLKEQSPWWPYINSLPDSFSTPLWYNENDLIWLRGTNLGKAKEIREEAWRQEYENAMQLLFSKGSDSQLKHSWTWELYLWAATVMTTRSFAGPTSFNRDEGDFVVASDGLDRCPVLIPGLDILNHNPSARVTWVWDAKSCALKVEDSTESGCQVWNNYNPKSNEELIIGYGFSLPHNSSDHYSLGFSPAITAYIKATRARRMARKLGSAAVQSQSLKENDNTESDPSRGTFRVGDQVVESSEDLNVNEILEQNIHWVRLLENKSYEFSPHFLENFSVAVENPRESHIADDCSIDKPNFSDGDFSRNKLHVLCAVTMILQKAQRAIRKNDKDLPQAPQNSKQVDAARYRRGQLGILDSVLNSMYSLLKSITTASPPKTNNPRVLRLEDIFTESPKGLLKDLRGVLNAGMRTRDPVKIRERGGVDFAFSVWLCGMWIYSRSDTKREDEMDPTYLRWLDFLQQNYAEPSEESIDDPRLEIPDLGERAEWFDPIRKEYGGARLESTLIARSYLDAVQAATGKRPQSLYNDKRVTLKRLEWCLSVIRNEGVWCPSLDQGEDEDDDDWVLFLERGKT